jgi:23S rRNA-intervening sequence protein
MIFNYMQMHVLFNFSFPWNSHGKYMHALLRCVHHARFISKMSDSDMENTETQVWLDFAFACEYITKEIYDDFNERSEEIGRLLNHMIQHPDKYK